jgi:cobalamin biosynthesis Mg chelatase CobN
MNLTPQEKVINGFIARKPELAIEFLRSQKVPLSSEPSLNEITARLYERYYQNDKAFNEALGKVIAHGDNVGFVITASIIVALVGTGVKAGVAKSKFEKDKRIAENQAEVAKNAASKQTQAQIEAERAQAVSTSVAEYKMQLEAESTARRKNAIIFVAAIGVLGLVAAIVLKK